MNYHKYGQHIKDLYLHIIGLLINCRFFIRIFIKCPMLKISKSKDKLLLYLLLLLINLKKYSKKLMFLKYSPKLLQDLLINKDNKWIKIILYN